MKATRTMVAMGVVVMLAGSAWAALGTTVLDYDCSAPGAWTPNTTDPGISGTLTSTVGGYTLTGEWPNNQWGPPTYHANGAGPADRAYLDFDLYAKLWDGGANASILNTGGSAQGHTMEAYFHLASNVISGNHGGFGANMFDTYPNESGNTFLNYSALYSQTSCTETGTAGNYSRNYTGPNGEIPRDEWVHIVKTHEVTATQSIVRWYVDGELKLTDTSIDDETAAGGPFLGSYPNRNEDLGCIGGIGDRYARYLGYSFFRAYQGTAAPGEVLALYHEAIGETEEVIPEPATITLLAGGLLGLLWRRRAGQIVKAGRTMVAMGVVLMVAGSAWAALGTKVLDYDCSAPGAWTAIGGDPAKSGTLKSTVSAHTHTAEGVYTDKQYGPPTYYASGAGPANRAYLDFTDWSSLYGGGAQGGILNTAGTAQGYTMEAYFHIPTNHAPNNYPGLGADLFATYNTQTGNTFLNYVGLYTDGGGNPTTCAETTAGGGFSRNVTTSPNASIPPDQWVHIVKTHETDGVGTSIVKYYVDGGLVSTDAVIDVNTPGAGPYLGGYTSRAEDLGSAGIGWRFLKNFGYSFFRAYEGTAAPGEVLALYHEAIGETEEVIPEPATLALLGVGGLGLLLRRRR